MASTTFDPRTGKGAEHMEKAKDASAEALNKAKEAGRDAIAGTKEAGADALHKAKDAGADALGKAKEAAVAVGEMASEAVSAVGQKADDLAGSAGHEIRDFGDNIAKKGPQDGLTGTASKAVADTIKGSGQYIEEAKLSGIARDVEQVVRNHPVPALLICFGIGYCVGRALKD
jgi:hypothetical protein